MIAQTNDIAEKISIKCQLSNSKKSESGLIALNQLESKRPRIIKQLIINIYLIK